jgi:hypothetical protein
MNNSRASLFFSPNNGAGDHDTATTLVYKFIFQEMMALLPSSKQIGIHKQTPTPREPKQPTKIEPYPTSYTTTYRKTPTREEHENPDDIY